MALLGSFVPSILAGWISPLEGMNRLVQLPTRNFTQCSSFWVAVSSPAH